MAHELERLWSAKVLGSSTLVPVQESPPYFDATVPSLKEENRELKRLLRDLVHFDVTKALAPKGLTGNEPLAPDSMAPATWVDGKHFDEENFSGQTAFEGGGGKFRDLPLPIQAEVQLFGMQKRFNEASSYVKENCTSSGPQNIGIQTLIQRLIATNAEAQGIYRNFQQDKLDVERFQWTKTRAEKQQHIVALEALVSQLEQDLNEHNSAYNSLLRTRKQIAEKIQKQQKDGLQWRSMKDGMSRSLSIMQHCFEYISNPAYLLITESTAESYVPNIIKGMKITINELMRMNRELNFKLHFAERQRAKSGTKMTQLYEGIVGLKGPGKSSKPMASTLSEKELDEAISPSMSLWKPGDLDRFEFYSPISTPPGTSGSGKAGKPQQFLNFLLACNGHFPFEYLSLISKSDLRDCLNFLGEEYSENVLRAKGLQCAFQNLQGKS